ncbi:metallophosphoesterase [Anaerocolumna xylanovorans]|uniref:3',5'-cyclic AMP phosphodiesterase CpdA n=1 Tax=Anaerocolumna xylanovorans DSM 12503 TaxID=1121345 RepID=A0A1M7Y1X2_9FIRM|nr:metallophosphoesterase [Anaerocolumna xylanovorans]SHO45592.1 3',5'-cyclic AMP phosphodiesterase CpdA [Anaerocolumna xylanovorans DSM 12503]
MPGGMKKLFITIYFAVLLTIVTGCRSIDNNLDQIKINSGEDINIFVATDIHYLAKSINDKGKAFENFFSSGDGKQLNYVNEIVDAFIYDIQDKKPDVLIISGDLTCNGEKESHLELAEKLREIEKTTETSVFVIPGNHDIQNPWARGFQGDEQYVTDSINSSQFKKIYKDFGYQEALSKDTATLSYMVAPSKDLWLLMLDTNVYENNYSYGSPVTYGEIKQETYKWIKECSRLAKKNGARLIAIMHHNLLDHNMVLNYGFTIDKSEEVIKKLSECDISLTLSGHVHMQDIKYSKYNNNTIYDIVTSALSVYPVQYGILEYTSKKGFYYDTARVNVEGWARKSDIRDRNLLNFKKYNYNFFFDISYKKTYDSLTETGIYSEEDKKLMAETMSILNANYFAGTVSVIKDEVMDNKGYKLWESADEPEFLTRYVRSMLYDYGINNNKLYIPDKGIE